MIVSTLRCALLLCDDYTGKAIQGPGAIFREQGRLLHPIRKPDGCWLFLNGGEGPMELHVSVPGYLSRQARVDPAGLPALAPLVPLRMFRAFPGSFADCGWLQGTGPPGAPVMALEAADGQLSLFREKGESAEEGVLLSLSGYTVKRLEGLRYALEDEGGAIRDFFLADRLPAGAFRAVGLEDWADDTPFPLRRAYRTLCDEEGRYRFPVEPGARIESVYRKEGGRWLWLSAAAPS